MIQMTLLAGALFFVSTTFSQSGAYFFDHLGFPV